MARVSSWNRGVVHWREAETAYLSVPFSWRVGEARRIALSYRAVGVERVVAGGPGVFTMRKHLEDVCEVRDPRKPGGRIPDMIVRHNPMATRASYGCPVACSFCIAWMMDGKAFTLLPDFPVRPILCDDNLSALDVKFQEHIIARYRSTGIPLLDANSGFEPATFDEDCFARWNPILKGPWRFGFDEATEGENVARAFRILRDVSPRRKQVYTMIGHEPFDVCMDRICKVIASGGEPYAQPFMKLNAIIKEPEVKHDWTALKLRQVQRWTNRHIWRKTPFSEYDASAKTSRSRDRRRSRLLRWA